MPVSYEYQRRNRITAEIFTNWYAMNSYQLLENVDKRKGKLENYSNNEHRPTHISLNKLYNIDEDFQVQFSPQNVTPLLQSMASKQRKTEKVYRKVLRRLLFPNI